MENSAHRLGIRWFEALLAVRSGWNTYVAGTARRFGLPVAGIVVALVILFFAARPLIRLLRMRRRVERARRGEASVADATLLYQRMLEILGKRGYEKPPWFTPAEFAASLPRTGLGTAGVEFTASYNALRFGGHIDAAPRLSMLLDRMDRE